MDRGMNKTGSRMSLSPLVAGGVIMCAGGLISLAGLMVCGVAIITGVRRWARDSEVPPRELAHRKWAQARSAVDASVAAWQDKGKEAVLAGNARRT
jgi:hypothetical protein